MATLEEVLEIQKKYNILRAPTRSFRPAIAATSATASTLDISLQNNTDSANVWAYITGLDINRNNAVFVLRSDGSTPYYPVSPSKDHQPLAEDCHIQLGAPGTIRTVKVPHLVGGRVWFCRDDRLAFELNIGPALVQPSVSNPTDANYNRAWGFGEFTFTAVELFANITYVEFVGLPVSMALTGKDRPGAPAKQALGIPASGLDTICAGLAAQHAVDGAGWDQLIIKDPRGRNLRALSPLAGIKLRGDWLFRDYYKPYVDAVWAKYSAETLAVNTQGQWGVVRGRVAVDSGRLAFGNAGAFAQPSAADIFACDSGAFAVPSSLPSGWDTEQVKNVATRLAAAFNRSTLLTNPRQPDGESVASYYREAITNHYARIVHEANLDRRGYTFAYDDVSPSDDQNVAGIVVDGNPDVFVVAVGGPAKLPATLATKSTVSLRELAGGGGRRSQMVGGRRGGGRARRWLSPSPTPAASQDWQQEKEKEKEREEEEEEKREMVGSGQLDLEKGGLIVPRPPSSSPVVSAVRRRIEALVARTAESSSPATARYVAPVVEAVGRAAVALMSLSARSLAARVVTVLLLCLVSLLAGWFGHPAAGSA